MTGFEQFVTTHYAFGKCKFCNYKHQGHHDYATHLQEQHPEDWEQFRKWAGIRTTEEVKDGLLQQRD